MKHDLKIAPQYFRQVADGSKTFEARRDDRGYQVGDVLRLREWDGDAHTGRAVSVAVTSILRHTDPCGDLLAPGTVVMSIRLVREALAA